MSLPSSQSSSNIAPACASILSRANRDRIAKMPSYRRAALMALAEKALRDRTDVAPVVAPVAAPVAASVVDPSSTTVDAPVVAPVVAPARYVKPSPRIKFISPEELYAPFQGDLGPRPKWNGARIAYDYGVVDGFPAWEKSMTPAVNGLFSTSRVSIWRFNGRCFKKIGQQKIGSVQYNGPRWKHRC